VNQFAAQDAIAALNRQLRRPCLRRADQKSDQRRRRTGNLHSDDRRRPRHAGNPDRAGFAKPCRGKAVQVGRLPCIALSPAIHHGSAVRGNTARSNSHAKGGRQSALASRRAKQREIPERGQRLNTTPLPGSRRSFLAASADDGASTRHDLNLVRLRRPTLAGPFSARRSSRRPPSGSCPLNRRPRFQTPACRR
jgi:hypothetical protein